MTSLVLPIGVALATWWVLGAPSPEKLAAPTPREARRARGRAGWTGAWVTALRALGRGRATPPELEALVPAAGRPLGLDAAEWGELERGWATAGGAVVVVALGVGLVEMEGALCLLPLAGGFALVAPREWLVRRARARAAWLDARLATLADRLATILEGGASIPDALQEAVRVEATSPRAPAWFVAELQLAARLLRLSDASLTESLATLGRAVPSPALARLSAQLVLAARTGGPTVAVLRDFARQLRAERAADRAGRVSDTPVRLAWVGVVPVMACLVVAMVSIVATLGRGGFGSPP